MLILRSFRHVLYWFALCYAPFGAAQNVAVDAAQEYEIKAAFLFNLGEFVRWPPGAFDDAPRFHICVLGYDPFGDSLDIITEGQSIGGRPVQVERLKHVAEALRCEILFIAASELWRLPSLLDSLRGQPVLTVGDMQDFAEAGGMVGFFNRNHKVRLALNPAALRTARLKPSAHLMQVAHHRVGDSP